MTYHYRKSNIRDFQPKKHKNEKNNVKDIIFHNYWYLYNPIIDTIFIGINHNMPAHWSNLRSKSTTVWPLNQATNWVINRMKLWPWGSALDGPFYWAWNLAQKQICLGINRNDIARKMQGDIVSQTVTWSQSNTRIFGPLQMMSFGWVFETFLVSSSSLRRSLLGYERERESFK